MTVPAPRGGETGQGDPTVLGILVETTRRIEGSVSTGFRDVRQDMAEMRRETVTRTELDQRLGAVVDDLTELKNAQQAQIDRVDRNKKWAITTAIAAIAALLTAIGVVIALVSLISHLH